LSVTDQGNGPAAGTTSGVAQLLLGSVTVTTASLPLTARLLERGMSPGDVEKVLGGNFMRVFEAVEAGSR
jgi:microsomal dipeptidase-like Zn-dependent dipeptidase